MVWGSARGSSGAAPLLSVYGGRGRGDEMPGISGNESDPLANKKLPVWVLLRLGATTGDTSRNQRFVSRCLTLVVVNGIISCLISKGRTAKVKELPAGL